MFEEELYAVGLDGEIGYCSLMGRNGQHAALAVYVGEQGVPRCAICRKSTPAMLLICFLILFPD